MATSLSATLSFILNWTFTNALDLSTTSDSARLNKGDTLANGTGLDQADQLWHDTRSLAATTENLDLAGGITNAFGTTVTFARVKGILIHNKNTTAGHTLTIGGASSAAFVLFVDTSDKYAIGPNGVFFAWEPSAAGKVVTATTADILKMDAGANTIAYDIWIIGATA